MWVGALCLFALVFVYCVPLGLVLLCLISFDLVVGCDGCFVAWLIG